jgi:hypothetical protein
VSEKLPHEHGAASPTSPQEDKIAGFQILLVVTIKIGVYWDVMSESTEKTRRLEGTFCFHLEGQREWRLHCSKIKYSDIIVGSGLGQSQILVLLKIR